MKLETWKVLFGALPRVLSGAKPEDKICVEFFSDYVKALRDGDCNALIAHITNEFSGDKRPVWGMLKSAMGRVKGAPDYIVTWQGGSGFIEVKAEDGRMSPEQVAFAAACEQLGIRHAVCRSKGAIIATLMNWGCWRALPTQGLGTLGTVEDK